MATLLLSAAGAAIGAGFGGTILGLSGAVIGRAIGATLGRAIDQRILGGGSDPVEIGRIDRLRLTGASEGAPVARVWGRMRVAGQAIWSSQFVEHANSSRGGKGGRPSVTQYSYSVSLAIGLCEGEILKVGRIWADGAEVDLSTLSYRVYRGTEDQLPDSKIEAIEGAGQAPAYRGLAYVVFEDLDLTPYGSRIPQFTFEVVRAAHGGEPTLADVIRAVALIPGTGEYALATSEVHYAHGPGRNRTANVNSASGRSDFLTSFDHLTSELPNVGSVSLVASWFGSDLRCGVCKIRPKVEQVAHDGVRMPWRSGGIRRAEALEVPRIEGRSIYGGTPADAAVIEAIRAVRAAGREVMFYPFILMDQVSGNGLADPWSGAASQPALPWRGRITCSTAPGRAGSPDASAAVAAEVDAFFGTAKPADFVISGRDVLYHGPDEWSFRRFVLHYATLCKAAGGVDAFCIGSELPGMTRLRDGAGGFPAVAALRQLAAEVRQVLGADCKLTYAADWTEYGSYVVGEDVHFPLDPLWSDPAIDFVGIDNYLPMSDWRDGTDHADAGWGAIHDLGYLKSNIAGGEAFDWYYDSPAGEAAQVRLPITDGAHGEPWVFRAKDLKGWWENEHYPRTAGVRAAVPTGWVPGSKPIRFTEYGCAAIDKATNQPNRFLDIHSSESALPRASLGFRDDVIQMQYYRAMAEFWADPANNPAASAYEGRMVDLARCHAWAWDSRPFPAFPSRSDLWSDGAAYGRGHWLNGRATNQPLAAVVQEICARSGGDAVDTKALFGVVRGYAHAENQTARATLQPLAAAFAFDAVERDGTLRFLPRRPGVDHQIADGTLAVSDDLDGVVEHLRASEPEMAGFVRLGHVESDGDYEIRAAEARIPDETRPSVMASDMQLVLTAGEASEIVLRWLSESRVARDAVRLALPQSSRQLGAGDRIELPDGSTYRVDRIDHGDVRLIEAVRVEGSLYERRPGLEDTPSARAFVAPVPVFPVFLDLPILTGEEKPHAPYVAVAADPWPGSVAVWSSASDSGFELNRLVAAPSIVGVTESELPAFPAGLWDRGPALRVKVVGGRLSAASALDVLNGANAMAIGDGGASGWEIFQFASATLVAEDTYDLSLRLRGQLGTGEAMLRPWPAGSTVVLLDRSLSQIDLPVSALGLARHYRIGAALRGYDDPNIVEATLAFDGVGLRPYSVAHLRATGRSGTPVTARWVRRTRLDGDGWNAGDVPLGEETETYLVRVMVGAAIRAEYTATACLFEYPASAQARDGVSSGFSLAVAQVSSRFGPGPFRQVFVPA
ncbi:baseplate multidomain protein megatron [Fuscovulum blasticum]|uniref:baseplate multidomain protein megatron n=1 Tax=Fuscovulum blasticum TaxID=1075 RepID=UPI000D3EAF22|nr:glycoside hydrolase/phage tail family protein [Fuscovulum blasticum]AWD20414.1 host specificity protein [Fuscovulum blasticum]